LLAKTYMDSGELVPDEVTVAMVATRFDEPDAIRGFVLDGFPRTVPQANKLAELLVERGGDVEKVLLLEVPDVVLLRRMSARGRSDDTAEAISRRLELYHSETKPLLEYYANKMAAIDGVGAIDEVHQRVLASLVY
jgi:adenylate kinase